MSSRAQENSEWEAGGGPATAGQSEVPGGGVEAASAANGQHVFEGRPLDRPEEDIEDQGLAFDLWTLIDRRTGRRGALGALGVGLGGLVLAACSTDSASGDGEASAASANADEYATETAGPYPGDGSNGPDVLEEAGIEQIGRASCRERV